MTVQLDTLRRVQELDSELFRLRHEQRQKPLALEAARAAVTEEEAKAKVLEARLNGLQLQQKEKELELATREAHVRKLQGQLFQVKTNKEYSAIQQEIAHAKADASLLEEEIIRLLDGIEQTKGAHSQQAAIVKERQGAFQQEEARVRAALAEIEGRIAALQQTRAGLTPQVDREVLTVYERVLASRDGLALVPLIRDSCGGCHMVQPPQVVNEAHLKARLISDSCNRILYVEDHAAEG